MNWSHTHIYKNTRQHYAFLNIPIYSLFLLNITKLLFKQPSATHITKQEIKISLLNMLQLVLWDILIFYPRFGAPYAGPDECP